MSAPVRLLRRSVHRAGHCHRRPLIASHLRCRQFSTDDSAPLYDVCIVGGGLVGSTLALALQSAPLTRHLSIALIEPNAKATRAASLSPTAPPDAPPSLRTISLSPASHALFSRLSAWQYYPASRLTPFRSMLVWQQHPTGHIHWKANEVPTSEPTEGERAVLGYSAENDLLLAAVYGSLAAGRQPKRGSQPQSEAAHAGVDVLSGESVAEIQLPEPPPASTHDFSPDTSSSRFPFFSSSPSIDIDELTRPSPPPSSASPAPSPFPALRLGSGRSIRCRLLVGSDGGNSAVQRAMSVPVVGWEYNQRAVVCNVRVSLPPSPTAPSFDTAYQRFLPSGPIAVLPCHSNYASVIWSMDAAEATRLCALSDEEFVRRVNAALHDPPATDAEGAFDWYQTFVGRLMERVLPTQQLVPLLFPTPFTDAIPGSSAPVPPRVSACATPRASFPLRFLHPLTPVQPPAGRALLLGDAAHVIHPLAGQGVNVGLRDVRVLAERVRQAVRCGADVGDPSFVVAEYERRRRWEGLGGVGLMAGVDALWRVFGAGRADGAGMAAWVRGLGMRAVNSVSSVKYAAADVSMGKKRETDAE